MKLSIFIATTVFAFASAPLAVLAQSAVPAPVELVPAIAPQVVVVPQTAPQEYVPSVETVQTKKNVEVNEKGETVTTTETVRTIETNPEGIAITPIEDTETHNDFIAFASEHCRAFIGEGKGNLGFALSKRVAAKFSEAERAEFNRAFAHKLITQYQIDASKPCVLNTVSMKPVEKLTHEPKDRSRHALPEAKHEIAVVSGQLASTAAANMFVSVSYRLERIGTSPWALTNITFNGQPLVDRYRAEYDALALKGGTKAIFDTL